MARLSGSEPPEWEDNEKTMAELIARIDKTIDYLKGFTAAQIDGTEGKAITRTIRGNPMTFTGLDYLQQFRCRTSISTRRRPTACCATAVCVGKLDFLGKLASNGCYLPICSSARCIGALEICMMPL